VIPHFCSSSFLVSPNVFVIFSQFAKNGYAVKMLFKMSGCHVGQKCQFSSSILLVVVFVPRLMLQCQFSGQIAIRFPNVMSQFFRIPKLDL
jgi:hypothetical protein